MTFVIWLSGLVGVCCVYLGVMGCWELIVLGYVEKLVPGLRDPDPWVRERVANA